MLRRSPLVRRLYRYRSLPALFRVVSPARPAAPAVPARLLPGLSPKLPLGSVSAPVSSPAPAADIATGEDREEPSPSPAVSRGSSPAAEEGAAPPVSSEERVKSAISAAEGNRVSPPAPVSPHPVAEEEETLSDGDWNRLQTIARRHREAATGEAELSPRPAVSPESAADISRSAEGSRPASGRLPPSPEKAAEPPVQSEEMVEEAQVQGPEAEQEGSLARATQPEALRPDAKPAPPTRVQAGRVAESAVETVPEPAGSTPATPAQMEEPAAVVGEIDAATSAILEPEAEAEVVSEEQAELARPPEQVGTGEEEADGVERAPGSRLEVQAASGASPEDSAGKEERPLAASAAEPSGDEESGTEVGGVDVSAPARKPASPPAPEVQRSLSGAESEAPRPEEAASVRASEPATAEPHTPPPPVDQASLRAAVPRPEAGGEEVQRPPAIADTLPSQPPLETVWQVEKRSAPAPSPRPAAPAEANLTESPETEAVRSLLSGVRSGRPSSSGIQLVMPRRPRPVIRRQATRRMQPEPEPRPERSQPETESAREVVPPAAPVPEPGVHLKGEAGEEVQGERGTPPLVSAPESRLPAPPESRAVETEIGPLPGDLWELIGKTPPVHERVEQPTVEVEEDVPAVQRRLAAPAAPAPVPVAEPASSEEEQQAEAPSETEIDVDELARQVYAHLKRRLAVEWERLRGRF